MYGDRHSVNDVGQKIIFGRGTQLYVETGKHIKVINYFYIDSLLLDLRPNC